MSNIRVAVIDAHPVFRLGVCQVLDQSGLCEVIAEGVDLEDACRIAQNHRPDVSVIGFPRHELRRDMISRVSASCPQMRILVLTVCDSEIIVTEALQAGAAGYMLKGASAAELVETVQRIHRGERYVFPALAARLLAAPKAGKPNDAFSGLTARETQILEQLTSGLTNKEIGRRLDISEKTVKHYVTSLLEKLRCRTRLEAALLARDSSNGPATITLM